MEDFVYPSAGQQIGGAQRFAHSGERHQRKTLDKDERNPADGKSRFKHVSIVKEYVHKREA